MIPDREISQRLIPIAEKACEQQQAFLVDVIVSKGSKKIIEIIAQTDTGIQATTCAEISKQVGSLLDEIPEFEFPFELVVSSPGIGRRIKTLRELKSQIGRKIKIQFEADTELKEYTGILLEIRTNILILEKKKGKKMTGERFEYEFSENDKITVEIDWN